MCRVIRVKNIFKKHSNNKKKVLSPLKSNSFLLFTYLREKIKLPSNSTEIYRYLFIYFRM